MTYGENKKITLALIEEYSPNMNEKTEDEDIALRLPFLYNLAYKELAMTKKIVATKTYSEIPDEQKQDRYTSYSLPSDLYQIKNIMVLDEDNKPSNADYYTVQNKIYINDNSKGTTVLEYYRYPQEINEETTDDFYLEIDEDAQGILPYKVADDILKTDPISDYTAFATEYQRKLQILDTRKNIPTVILKNVLSGRKNVFKKIEK